MYKSFSAFFGYLKNSRIQLRRLRKANQCHRHTQTHKIHIKHICFRILKKIVLNLEKGLQYGEIRVQKCNMLKLSGERKKSVRGTKSEAIYLMLTLFSSEVETMAPRLSPEADSGIFSSHPTSLLSLTLSSAHTTVLTPSVVRTVTVFVTGLSPSHGRQDRRPRGRWIGRMGGPGPMDTQRKRETHTHTDREHQLNRRRSAQ